MIYSLCGGVVLGLAIANMNSMPDLCAAQDSDCNREWVSALSGWAAGIAAIFAAILTVKAIRAQIAEGSKQHLELMKFQAHEKLLLVQQVAGAASNAQGTVVQIFHEFHDQARPMTHERIRSYIDAAKFALEQLDISEFSHKRAEVQGSMPPQIMRAENSLPKFIEFAELALKMPDHSLAEEMGENALRNASTYLNLAHEDLKALSEEMVSFRKRWLHLTP